MTTVNQSFDLKSLKILPLADANVLSEFDCGEREIDRNIPKCCERHQKFRNRVFCAFHGDEKQAVGFYCLGIHAHSRDRLPESLVKKAGDYAAFLPFIYLHYLAVTKDMQKNGIGTILLLNAMERSLPTVKNIGIFGIALNALNTTAGDLYYKYGFREYGDRAKYPLMVLPAQALIDLTGS